ncbi:MAG: Uncharacterized protein Athens071426_185 [Parcubacteria group bacterium Athens0714_26]|nr:MAG: Uncharacterized protein Athens101426_411 [Parcubacteria group bacterium Athens1014_26]TSD03588.1 MAG: Uncharacterized protein Athens071426_185 [Parcubacteria group bacterium Athens0714_26]
MENQENQNLIKNVNDLIEKADKMKKQEKMDLSSDEDLSIAIMNLVSIEEHFFFTGAKTGKTEYYDLLKDVREIRKVLLKKIIKEYEGEVWCISKHLLAASMRLMEVGTKQLGMGKKDEAAELFQKAYDLYSLFWGLNMKLIKTSDIKRIDENAINKHDYEKGGLLADRHSQPVSQRGFLGKLGDLVKKAIDCCIE